MWCEVNVRVNYPIKAILVQMVDQGEINIDNPLHFFCISWISIRVAFVGIELFVNSWNHHPIPGMFNSATSDSQKTGVDTSPEFSKMDCSCMTGQISD